MPGGTQRKTNKMIERAGMSPKMAQTLAGHGDIRLTLGVYTHVGVGDRVVARAAGGQATRHYGTLGVGRKET
ncbi:MAG: hypothetical protein A2V98_18610 [Planctomycetes bacterium RBG_16_64_12]|nr:MAG: hypothetical protein A2V98_18610 [Planctomycetes bacterium RBG_16_64_12]